MLTATDTAIEAIREQLDCSNPSVRISIMLGSCAGPNLRLSADDARESDQVFDQNGVRFVVSRALLTACGAIKVDYIEANTRCLCSSGCGGFCISGEKQFHFRERCNYSGGTENGRFCCCEDLVK